MENIKVSVIVPVFNAEEFISSCLTSMVEQTLKEIEIICVDDGSVDGSRSILERFAEQDRRIRIIHQANSGAGAARNVGLSVARGEYLSFLDSDDLFSPTMLEEAYAAAHSEEAADVVLFCAECFDESGVLREERLNSELLSNGDSFSPETLPDFIFQLSSCNTWSKLYRRQFIHDAGLEYQGTRTANDLYFVYMAMAAAGRIKILDRVLVRHRILRTNNLQSIKIKTPMDFFEALLELKSGLIQRKSWEKYKQSFINCAAFHCVYNYRTLDEQGKACLASKSKEIYELLEFAHHPYDYYYNNGDYEFLLQLTGNAETVGNTGRSRQRDILKRVLPPPVKTFLRETGALCRMIRENRSSMKIQHRQQTEKLDIQMAQIERLSKRLDDIQKTQAEILQRLTELGKKPR